MLGDKDMSALKWNEIEELLDKGQALFLNGLIREIGKPDTVYFDPSESKHSGSAC